MPAETARGEGQTPGGVDGAKPAPSIRTGGKAAERAGLWVKYVDQTVAGAFDVIVFRIVLFGEGYEDVAGNGLDVERGVSGRRAGIRELPNQSCGRVISVHGAARKVSRQEQRPAQVRGQGDTLVHRSATCHQHFRRVAQGRAPTGD